MPLRDHFHYPANKRARWDKVHGGWPMVASQHLNRLLPAKYTAGPNINIGHLLEVDVAVFEEDDANEFDGATVSGGTALQTETWAPPAPSLVAPANWSTVDYYEIEVYSLEEEQELVATIELVSPSNKDRPETRRLFINKCAGLLQAGVCVSIIDIVTNRQANLYAELLEAVGQADPLLTAPPQAIYSVTCRSRAAKRGQALETWFYPLVVGQPLPTLPIWLTEKLAVPLELETIYEETLRDLRIN